jgi:inosine-uridine nucleoside N-ribohydrolase
MAHKILLDTDIGSDIDDAVCLAYLLAQPECDLVGITTVSGEGKRRAMIASAQCMAAGKQVPIYIGAESPLLITQRQPQAPQAAALDRWAHATDFPTGQAVEFMRRTIRQHPGEITLLTIGPLTNIALLFATDPEIPALLKGLVLMAGSFTAGHYDNMEWNVILDPHAAAMVYRTAIPIHRSIGLDVTMQVQMPAEAVRRRFQTPLLRPVLDFAEVWFKERDLLTFHDPLAATTIFDPHICGFERGQVSVEIADQATLGKTSWGAAGVNTTTAPHEIATTVAAARFFDHYFGVFGN